MEKVASDPGLRSSESCEKIAQSHQVTAQIGPSDRSNEIEDLTEVTHSTPKPLSYFIPF